MRLPSWWPSVSTPNNYRPLHPSSQPSDTGRDDDNTPQLMLPERGFQNLSCWFICVFCTAFNIYTTLGTPSTTGATFNSWAALHALGRKDIPHLRRPSAFIGFDSISRPSLPMHKTINTFPIVLTQIDETNPQKVFNDDAAQYLSPIGTIAAEKRRVLVTNAVSTILQFRATDWGTEQCELQLVVPSSADVSVVPPERSFTLSLYRLDAPYPIDSQSLSFSARPARIAKHADIYVASGTATNFSHIFPCILDELMTFELACSRDASDNDCMLQWWQDKEDPIPGIFITQFSSA
ncbi:hypothetical protein BC834DRAFT_905354 [Gloeopeniophorella convolvens]|nr:hypothetical protein BC834DRAFT_905354 [Gloeopeniophorella convolvens]